MLAAPLGKTSMNPLKLAAMQPTTLEAFQLAFVFVKRHVVKSWEFDFYVCCAASERFMTQMWVSRCRHPLVWPFQLCAITWAGIHVNTVWEHDSIRLAAMCAELLMPVSSWIWMKVQALKKIKKTAEQTSFPGFPLYYNTVSAAFFSPFFVSYVTQVTQAWPLLSVFFFFTSLWWNGGLRLQSLSFRVLSLGVGA